jgi:hypothetical protein
MFSFFAVSMLLFTIFGALRHNPVGEPYDREIVIFQDKN